MDPIRVELGNDTMPDGITPLKNIETYSNADVLCGRGGGTNNHAGNNHWRALVTANKRLYISLPKKQKVLVAKSIVHAVRSQTPGGGRFLQKDTGTGLWNDIGDQKATEKTSQALREGAPDIRSEMELEKQSGSAGNNADNMMMAFGGQAAYKPGQILPNGLITLDYGGVHSSTQNKTWGPLRVGTMDVNRQLPQMQGFPIPGMVAGGHQHQQIPMQVQGATGSNNGGQNQHQTQQNVDPMMQAFQNFMGGMMPGMPTQQAQQQQQPPQAPQSTDAVSAFGQGMNTGQQQQQQQKSQTGIMPPVSNVGGANAQLDPTSPMESDPTSHKPPSKANNRPKLPLSRRNSNDSSGSREGLQQRSHTESSVPVLWMVI